ncbi:hypothetical protein Dimus_031897 [Dionaea muscipula]
MRLASILGVPGNNGIYEYIKEVWEESKYIKPLEITRKFANDELLTATRRARSTEIKPFQRVMMRHMSYVISVKDHELPCGDWLTMMFKALNVPLVDKQGEEPKRYEFFEETFLTMCQLKRENGVWWLGTVVHEEAEIQGESGLGEKFFDAEDQVQGSKDVIEEVPVVPAPTSVQQKETEAPGVDPSAPTGSIPDSTFDKLQDEFGRARADRIQDDFGKAQAENARLLSLLQQAESQPKP